jgi:pyruvate formate lyase activating enzyme
MLAIGLATDAGSPQIPYVYVGNCPGHERNSTFCPGCGRTVIERVHFAVLDLKLNRGRCPSCGCEIPGIGRDV